MFYPAEAETLRTAVADYLSVASDARAGADAAPPKMLVVPHAGYVYSGPVAAHAYALLAPWRGRITRVVLLGPTHRVAVRGIAVPAVSAFDTPLGPVPLDCAAIDGLKGLAQVVESDLAHAQEHSLEVQLPFLQAVLGDFSLVPLAVGDVTSDLIAEVVERLWGGDETLIVISSDLSHYLPHARAREIDSATVARILNFDSTIGHDEACGATPLNGALEVARAHGLKPYLLDLRNSGDTAGDRSRVVGYCAIAFRPVAASQASADSGAQGAGESGRRSVRGPDALGLALLSRARNAIAAPLGLAQVEEPAHAELARPGASFVTLHRNGELRGCIGRLEAGEHSLDEDVRRNAHRAAFADPRFAPLAVHEFLGLEVEVSVLGALEAMPAVSESDAHRMLRPYEDGVVFSWRGYRSTFLPQVWEQLPDARDFLAALRQKAGLPADFWHVDVMLSRYSVHKFADDEVLA